MISAGIEVLGQSKSNHGEESEKAEAMTVWNRMKAEKQTYIHSVANANAIEACKNQWNLQKFCHKLC